MMMPGSIPDAYIAPCGIDCFACYAHLREKKRCGGCNGPDNLKPKHCLTCRITLCASEHGVTYCHECDAYPCHRLRSLSRTYRTYYGVNPLENGAVIRERGKDAFLEQERSRWSCSGCGGVVSQHDSTCSECGSRV